MFSDNCTTSPSPSASHFSIFCLMASTLFSRSVAAVSVSSPAVASTPCTETLLVRLDGVMSALLSSFAASLQREEQQALTTQSDLAFTPRPSLWQHVSSLLQPAERNEAKLVIGPAAILDNQQLHNEVRSLIDIVTSLQLVQITPAVTTAPSSFSTASATPLPYGIPPLRLRGFEADRSAHLKDEIAGLVAAIRSKARQQGDADTARIWSPRSDREKSIVALVEKESANNSDRSSSHSSRCSTARPSTASTARSASSASSAASRPTSSSLSSSVASLSSLSIFSLDSAVTRIQAALQSEREELLRDIDYLKGIIEDEEEQADDRRKEEQVAPSETELRALSKQLKTAVANEESAERTRRLLSALPNRAPFKASKPDTVVKAVEQQESCEQQSSIDATQLQPAAADESVQSMLSSLDELEAAFFHTSEQQQPSSDAASTTSSASLTSSITRTVPPASPFSASSRRSSTGVFTIRPPSPASSSLASATSATRNTRASTRLTVHAGVVPGSQSVQTMRSTLPQLVA